MKTRRIPQFVVVAGLLGLSTMSLASEGNWIKKADMPTARFGLSASVVDGRIYVIGGTIGQHHDFRIVEEYDPATDSWTKKADMSNVRCWHSASVVNGKIYVIGGFAAEVLSGMVEEYDPATDTWTRKADMPTARWWLSTSVVNDKIYAIGGAGEAFGEWFDTVEEYDPETDTWTRKADMLTRRFALSTGVVNGKIYAIGGASEWGTFVRPVGEYDPATNTWTRREDIPTPRGWVSTSVVNGKVYAIGGCVDVHGATFSVVEAYDPETDTWTEMDDMPTPRKSLATSVVNGKVYAIGGSAVPHWDTGFSIVEEYDPNPLVVDFNGDGIVDCADMCLMVDYWGTDEQLYDIAPRPFGDGIVDVLDLELLMSYWKQPVDDPTLLVHWALDEVEGIIAYDSAGVNDAVVVGATDWQPSGGQVDGALQLNGIDGYAVTRPILNPADGPFSVFAWIKGGAPGQVVISQQNGANWLGTDPTSGCLMTELIPPAVGRFVPQPLKSECVITDGQWHRIGFVWNGANRTLYVDDILVTEDTQANLQGSDAGLYIGTGKAMELRTYWSGLIDDVRIYNRALRP